jgi:hypothetical protein
MRRGRREEACAAPPQPSRLLVAGDSHGSAVHAHFLIERAQEQRCDAILHLGDLGFWPKWTDFLDYTRLLLDDARLPLYFVEGNHEDYPRLLRPVAQVGAFRLVVPPKTPAGCGIWHIARGARWSWRGIRFLGVGGGYSIDKRLRAPGIDWFPEESISDEQYQQITSDPDQVDVCVFHDAPYGAPLPFELYPIFDAVWNRELLAKIVNHVRPALILHAHYHVAYEGRWQDKDTGASAGVVGLDCDLNPQRSWLVLDLDQARSRLGALRQGEQPGLLPECEAEPPA